jgi:hypothetical protein
MMKRSVVLGVAVACPVADPNQGLPVARNSKASVSSSCDETFDYECL